MRMRAVIVLPYKTIPEKIEIQGNSLENSGIQLILKII
jgi:hypothetical protein